MAQRRFEMLFHSALRLQRIFGGDSGSDCAMRFGGLLAVILTDVLLGGCPAHRLFDRSQNGCEERILAGLHQQFVKFVITRTVGCDAALGDSGDSLALWRG